MGQLDHSGLYNRWISAQVGESKIVTSSELESSATTLGDLRVTFFFLALGLSASLVVFLVEAMKKKSLKQKAKTKLFHTVNQLKARSKSV